MIGGLLTTTLSLLTIANQVSGSVLPRQATKPSYFVIFGDSVGLFRHFIAMPALISPHSTLTIATSTASRRRPMFRLLFRSHLARVSMIRFAALAESWTYEDDVPNSRANRQS